MRSKKQLPSLRRKLIRLILFCWVLPVLAVALVSGILLDSGYRRFSSEELETSARSAVEQISARMETIFAASKAVSYDGVVRSAYRKYQESGNEAELYRQVTESLGRNISGNERILAAFLTLWQEPGLHPYASNSSEFGYRMLQQYRSGAEPVLLERMKDADTGIVLYEVDGELYAARNLLDSRLSPYATVVLMCGRSFLTEPLQTLKGAKRPQLVMDGTLILNPEGTLCTVRDVSALEPYGNASFSDELEGHVFMIRAELSTLSLWADVSMLQLILLLAVLLVIPLLLVMISQFGRFISRPVQTLVDAEERLQEGERGYQIREESGSIEFDALYRHFNLMSEELQAQFERSYQEQQELQQAKIKALQSQINPHFLNNTLEVINWQSRIAGNDQISGMIEALSTMLNAALDRDGRSRIPLREEMSYVDAYLHIIRERIGDRLMIRREIDESLMDQPVPRLILQPIVENAVEHDISERKGGILILTACRNGDEIVLTAEHEGRLSCEDLEAIRNMLDDPSSDTEIRGRIGLRNVAQRLRLLYGDKGRIWIRQSEEDRIIAGVAFPADV